MSDGCAILNPNAGTAAEQETIEAALAPLGNLTVHRTAQPGDARAFAAQAVADGCTLVIAAGGDGTINEVVNGLAANWGQAKLGIVPLGTGNDFARTIGIPADIAAAVAAIQQNRTIHCDIVQVSSTSTTNYLINVSAGGFSGLVDEKLTAEMKSSWGPLAYLRAAALALPDLAHYEMSIQFDDDQPQLILAYNIIVANGRFVAGGWPVAPTAILDDGLMDVIVVPALPATKIGLLAPQLFLGRHLSSDELIVRRARRFNVDSKPGMWFNADGELVGNEPAHFEVLPQVLEVIVGPDYDPQPAEP